MFTSIHKQVQNLPIIFVPHRCMRLPGLVKCLRAVTSIYSIATAPIFRGFSVMSTDSTLLSCQKNSYAKESHNKVLYCQQLADSTSYRVLLDDSVLYPEGGGQPFDLGLVNGFQVSKVLKPTVNVEELVEKGTDTSRCVEVELAGPVEVGSVVKCEVDWNRRYDFMQQHTAQVRSLAICKITKLVSFYSFFFFFFSLKHLFSAVADILYKADTVGWALGPDSCTVDLASDKPLTPQQIQNIEDETNARIRTGAKVEWKVFSKDELQLELNREVKSNGFENMRGEVKGAALEMSELRLISIDGVDLNPCGGTHVQSLAELNLLKVIGMEKMKSNSRIRFVAGNRALQYFRDAFHRETTINSKLSTNAVEQVAFIDKLLKEKRDLNKRYDVYSSELAVLLGESIVHKADPSIPLVVVQHRPGGDLNFLILLATAIIEQRPDALILLSGDDGMPKVPDALSKKSDKKGKNAPPPPPVEKRIADGPFVLFGDPVLIDRVKETVLSTLGGRGGGRPGRLQGQATQLQALESLTTLLQDAVNNK